MVARALNVANSLTLILLMFLANVRPMVEHVLLVNVLQIAQVPQAVLSNHANLLRTRDQMPCSAVMTQINVLLTAALNSGSTMAAGTMAHQACHGCGYYKGIKVMVTKADRAIKRGQAKQAKVARLKTEEPAPAEAAEQPEQK